MPNSLAPGRATLELGGEMAEIHMRTEPSFESSSGRPDCREKFTFLLCLCKCKWSLSRCRKIKRRSGSTSRRRQKYYWDEHKSRRLGTFRLAVQPAINRL